MASRQGSGRLIYTQGGSSFDAAKGDLPGAIEISIEKLDEYVGSYSFGFGFEAGNMVISRDGEQMYGKLASKPKLKIIPVSEDEFAWVDVAATMKFVRDKEGNITAVILRKPAIRRRRRGRSRRGNRALKFQLSFRTCP